MYFSALSRHLTTERLPAYCIYGEDEYLCAKALEQLTALVSFCPELNVSFLTAPAASAEIAEAAQVLPLGEIRLTVVKEYAGKEFDAVNAYLKSPAPTSTLVFYYPGGDMPLKLKGAEPVNCRKLDTAALTRWIRGKLAVTDEGAELLAALCSQSMSRISAETEKLKSYDPDGVLTAEDVRALVAPDAEYRIYKLADAAARGEGARAFEMLDGFIADKFPPVTLMSTVAGHFRRLLYVSLNGTGEDAARALGAKPYALESAARQARLFTQRNLKKIADLLREYELSVKSGKMNDYGALMLAVNGILLSGK
jgi:DNA polymerase III delta subunit